MHISARSDYAVRAALGLAAAYPATTSSASLAAARNEDPAPYLDESIPILERLSIIAMSRIDLAAQRDPAAATPA